MPTRTVKLPSGEAVPALGLGTWRMGEDVRLRAEEIATIRLALELGVTLLDTAEMYGDGKAEELIGEAIQGRRDQTFLVSKVYPHNASRKGTPQACARSLARLRTDRIDLYLLHWRGNVPLAETLEAFQDLQQSGKIRHFGVSNLDRGDLEELWSLPGGRNVATDQILYNMTRRGPEWDLLPWLRQHEIPLMAYSPIEQGRLLEEKRLQQLARSRSLTAAQVALAWLLEQGDVIAIPKTSRRERLRENAKVLELSLDQEAIAQLNAIFPPPKGPAALEML